MQEPPLTIEQSFELEKVKIQIRELSHEELQQRLIELYGLMLMRDNFFRKQLGQQWGIEQ